MMRRFILTLEILFVSLFLLGGSFPETETVRNISGGFSWKDYRTIAHALGGMDGKDYLNSREGFLFMYEQGVRLFELDLSRTSDGVWVCRHNWNDSMGQWDGNGKKVLTEKEFRQSKIYGKYTPMTLEDYSDYVEIARNAGAGEALDQIIPEIYNEVMFPGTAMLYSFPSYVYSLWQEYSVEELEHIASFCKEKGIPAATVYWEYWSEETEKIFEKNGISLYVYTVNDRDQARRYISQGAEGICTDFLTAEDLW